MKDRTDGQNTVFAVSRQDPEKMENETAAYLAVDIGAGSGRHILGSVVNGKISLREVYRFDNNAVEKNGHICWDIDDLYHHILEGIKAAKAEGSVPKTVGIDTWGVDFVFLDKDGRLVGDAVSYRDARTEGVPAEMEREGLSFEELYRRTGIQKLDFNSIYQLRALQKESPELFQKAERLLMIPDYFHYRLTGKIYNEYTAASTTALFDAGRRNWDFELIDRLGYPRRLFGSLAMPGTVIGRFSEEVKNYVGFDCDVCLPASHDTGSAYIAVPAADDTSVYLSSGTWSLLGVEMDTPFITNAGRKANFTNEGGYNGRIRYLRNIMGLWMIQSVRRNTGEKYSYAELEGMAREHGGYTETVNVNERVFIAPDNMVDAIRETLERDGKPLPQSLGETLNCIYYSLADSYAAAIKKLEGITGTIYTGVNIVGGGSKDGYLNELTARATGLPVTAGPTEGTAIGNLLVQMISGGEFADLVAARAAVAGSFQVEHYQK